MTDLKTYTDQAITELLDGNGAFFAFGNKQFEEGRKEGVKYVSMGIGLVCPKANAKTVHDGLDNINKLSIAQDMEENSTKDIIWREFANYECQIPCSPEDAIDALKGYPITKQEILAQWDGYWAHCVEHDLF